MGNVTYKDKTEKVHKKRVYFSGTDTLQEGYPLCYDRNQGTAADEDLARAYEVEKPASGNLNWFAGVVAEGHGGKKGPCEVEIIEPTPEPGTACNVWVGVATVIPGAGATVTPLGLVADTYALKAAGPTYPGVGYALTTDASTTPKARLTALVAGQMAVMVTPVAPALTGGTTGGTVALGATLVSPALTGGTTGATVGLAGMTSTVTSTGTFTTALTAIVANTKRAFEAIADLGTDDDTLLANDKRAFEAIVDNRTDIAAIITALKKAKLMDRK